MKFNRLDDTLCWLVNSLKMEENIVLENKTNRTHQEEVLHLCLRDAVMIKKQMGIKDE